MKPLSFLTALLACAVCIGTAEAKDNRNRKPPVDEFKKLDTNHDGMLSKDEFKGDSAAFDKLDKNHDGKLDRYEFSQLHKKH